MTDGFNRFARFMELQEKFYELLGRLPAPSISADSPVAVHEALSLQMEYRRYSSKGFAAMRGCIAMAQMAAFTYAPDDSDFAKWVNEQTAMMTQMLELELAASR